MEPNRRLRTFVPDGNHVQVTGVTIHADGTQDVRTKVITAAQDAADRARRTAMALSSSAGGFAPEATIIQDTTCDDHSLWLYSAPGPCQTRLCLYNSPSGTPAHAALSALPAVNWVFQAIPTPPYFQCAAATLSDYVYEYYPGSAAGCLSQTGTYNGSNTNYQTWGPWGAETLMSNESYSTDVWLEQMCCPTSHVTCSADAACCGAGESCVTPDGGVGACQVPSNWLYTSGNKINKSTGTGGTQWMARGVNVDDLFLGGGNSPLGSVSDAGGTLRTLIANLVTTWKPTFLRVSLDMKTYATVSWLDAGGTVPEYKTQMTEVINSIGSLGVYVLVTLRSDASMIDECTGCDDPEATGLPSNSTNAPSGYPGGTDRVYRALVDSFAGSTYSNFIIFGVSNEPGGGTLDGGTISSAMGHAVSVIRAEEDLKGVPHHLVSVQGKSFTSDLSIYPNSSLSWYDNVVYEYHAYTTPAAARTDIPVIAGEYGPQWPDGGPFDAGAFYTNVEANKIPNLAWDLEPFGSTPVKYDLVHNNDSATHLDASAWGAVVQTYLGDPDAY